jgi:magnesium-transporting ATPase (P-type)
MGIRCIMLTGDKREVAEWVAQEIGLRGLPLRRNGCIIMFWATALANKLVRIAWTVLAQQAQL